MPRLNHDMFDLKALVSSRSPIKRFVRGDMIAVVRYGFGDASRTSFGSSLVSGSDKVKYRYVVWGSDKEHASSNFKEFNNLVEALEVMRDDEDGLN